MLEFCFLMCFFLGGEGRQMKVHSNQELKNQEYSDDNGVLWWGQNVDGRNPAALS